MVPKGNCEVGLAFHHLHFTIMHYPRDYVKRPLDKTVDWMQKNKTKNISIIWAIFEVVGSINSSCSQCM